MPLETIALPQGAVRVRTAGAGARTLVFAADPPNVLELYGPLFARLKPHARLVAFEPIGCGHSRAARGTPLSLPAQADAAEALLDRMGIRGAVLVFPCASAFAALALARRRPDLVAALVLPQAPSWPQWRAWTERVDPRGILRAPVVGPVVNALRLDAITRRWYAAATGDPERARHFASLAIECYDHGARFPLARLLRAAFAGPAPEAAPPGVPVLGIWGPADRSHRSTDPDSLRAHAPHADLVRLDGCGHAPELEDPARFVDVLLAWLDDG